MDNKWKNRLITFTAFVLGGVAVFALVLWGVKKENSKKQNNDYMATIVIDGVEMDIPNKYQATVLEDMGLMYWDEGHFDMLISPIEGDYRNILGEVGEDFDMSQLDSCQEIIPFTEIAIGGRSYIYMLYEDSGDLIMYAYSDVEDDKSDSKIFQIIVFCYDMDNFRPQAMNKIARECEQMLLVADSVISTARLTDEGETPAGELYISDEIYDELRSNMSINISGDMITEDSLQDKNGNKLVTYDVADGFSYEGELYNSGGQPMKMYFNYDEDISAKVYVEGANLTAEEYVNQGATIWGNEDTKVYTHSVGSKEYWYYSYSRDYTYEGEDIVENYIVVVTALNEELLYCVMLETTDEGIDLLEISNKFMTIKTEYRKIL